VSRSRTEKTKVELLPLFCTLQSRIKFEQAHHRHGCPSAMLVIKCGSIWFCEETGVFLKTSFKQEEAICDAGGFYSNGCVIITYIFLQQGWNSEIIRVM
jgi:hypothetical protein